MNWITRQVLSNGSGSLPATSSLESILSDPWCRIPFVLGSELNLPGALLTGADCLDRKTIDRKHFVDAGVRDA